MNKRDLSEYLESAVTLEREMYTLERLRKELESSRIERLPTPQPPRYPPPPEEKKIPPPPQRYSPPPMRHFIRARLARLMILLAAFALIACTLSQIITIARLESVSLLVDGIEKIREVERQWPVIAVLLFAALSATLIPAWAHWSYRYVTKTRNGDFKEKRAENDREAENIRKSNKQAAFEHEKKCEAVKRKYEQEFRDAMAHNDNADLIDAAVAESQQTIAEEIRKLDETLSGIYGLNIVYPKYHNLVAFASFHEYLQSGRCETLEGTQGAYDIFEREVRADAMVRQLKSLNAGLLQIGENQHKLYAEITAANNHAKALAEHVREKIGRFSDDQHRMSDELAAARRDSKRLAEKVTGLDSHLSRVSAQNAKISGNIASLERRLRSS